MAQHQLLRGQLSKYNKNPWVYIIIDDFDGLVQASNFRIEIGLPVVFLCWHWIRTLEVSDTRHAYTSCSYILKLLYIHSIAVSDHMNMKLDLRY